MQKNMAHIMEDFELSANDPMPVDYLVPIKRLWTDAGVKAAISKGNEFALHDNLD
jgi:guanine nucleotide-binding protein subunit alpha, other